MTNEAGVPGPEGVEKGRGTARQRKRNWNAGLTLAQQAMARRIQEEHARAYDDERARGAFGAPGSIWAVVNGALKLRVPSGREQALMTDAERARYATALTTTVPPSAIVTGKAAASGVDELPPLLRARYRSKRHLEALVQIDRLLRGVGMTWASLGRALEEPAAAPEWAEHPAGKVLRAVERLERVRPWDPTSSSAPGFLRSLRELAGKGERVALSPRQAHWLDLLLARAAEMEREPPRAPPVTATNQPNEADTGNVVQLRPRGRAL